MDNSGLRERVADIVYDLNDEAGRYQALLPVKKRTAYVDAILAAVDAEYRPLLVAAKKLIEMQGKVISVAGLRRVIMQTIGAALKEEG